MNGELMALRYFFLIFKVPPRSEDAGGTFSNYFKKTLNELKGIS